MPVRDPVDVAEPVTALPSPFVPPADRDPDRVEHVAAALRAARRDFDRAAGRYGLAQEARAEAVRAARDAGLSHDEIAAALGVTRAVAIRLDRRKPGISGI